MTVNTRELIFNNSGEDRDIDDLEAYCTLHVSAGSQYIYRISDDTLILKNNLTNLEFQKTGGLAEEGLVGTWTMEEEHSGNQIITEIIVEDLEEIRLRKTCNLK